MRRLLTGLLPTSRIGMALWAWRNRYRVLDWFSFALRALSGTIAGNGTSDAEAELRLRVALARDSMTRGTAVDVRVENGVATLTGRVSPEVHARMQDKAVAIPGIRRVDDRLVNVSPRKRFRLRAAY
ncbi:MAG TPA: BON domain-containing protein [Acidimicrobiales bacterium]